jgi:ferredoxin-NADP reductase
MLDWSDPPTLILVSVTVACGVLALLYLVALARNAGPPTVLPLEEFIPLRLLRKDILSHDTRRFTFALPNPKAVLGLPTGQHVVLKCTHPDTGKPVQRSYTPVTDNRVLGEMALVIKVYRPNDVFPQGGTMSQHVDDLRIGDAVLVKGPKGHLNFYDPTVAAFTVKPLGKPLESRTARNICLLAGGTGLTPCLQILHAIFRHENNDNSHVSCKMIYANQTPDDILCREELETLARAFPTRFQVWYTVDRTTTAMPTSNGSTKEAEETWAYDVGFLNKKMIEKHGLFPGQESSTQFFMCGPPPMIKFACLPALQELGFSEKDWVIF